MAGGRVTGLLVWVAPVDNHHRGSGDCLGGNVIKLNKKRVLDHHLAEQDCQKGTLERFYKSCSRKR